MRMPPPPSAPPPLPPRQKHPARVAAGRRVAALSPANKKNNLIVGEDGIARYGNGRIPTNGENKRARIVNWNDRHQLILWMDIAGRRSKDIAAEIGMMDASVSAIRNSPLYQAQKAALIEKLTGSTLEDLMEMIRRDAPKNLQVLIDLRDKLQANGGDAKVVLGAAKQLSREADRVYPRKTHHVEDRTIRISIEAAQLNRLAGALREIGHDVPADLVVDFDPINSDPNAPPIAGKSVEELIDQYRAETAAGSPD